MKFLRMLLMINCVTFSGLLFAKINNFHEIETDDNGFAMYRYGQPSREGVRELCDKGVQEVMVLSGNAKDHEFKYQDECPGLKVIYNIKQSSTTPVTKEFLETFDKWVADSKEQGKKIAFRCACGCHRTGRLAAYYQMKYQHVSLEDALLLMKKHGKYMFLMPHLIPQVKDMHDYLAGLPCAQKEKHCIVR